MFLGIDIGSSYIKSALLDVRGGFLTNIKRHKTPPLLHNDDFRIKEYDPEVLIYHVKGIADSYIDNCE